MEFTSKGFFFLSNGTQKRTVTVEMFWVLATMIYGYVSVFYYKNVFLLHRYLYSLLSRVVSLLRTDRGK